MSSLKAIEKRVFEDLFGMGSGYVLDIYAPKYANQSGSHSRDFAARRLYE